MAYVSQEMKKELAPAIKAVLKEFGMKGSISVRNHSTLCVNIKAGEIDFSENYTHGDRYIQVNEYWIDEHYKGVAQKFNNDDAMTDYFSRSHYTDINIGQWNKPYEVTA
jgi:hypothetical protein